MKKMVLVTIMAVMLISTMGVHAYTVDGSLSDWGVTPFSSWAPSSPTADWSGNQNYQGPGSYPHGGESFDAEAMYFDDDLNNIYVALVVSMGPTGTPHPYTSDNLPVLQPGDLAIDLTGADADNTPYEYGFGIYNFTAQLMAVSDWSLPHGSYGFPANTPSTIVSGASLGTGSLVYANAGDLEGNGTDTFIIEACIAKSLFGVADVEWENVNLYWTMSCGNDTLSVNGTTIPSDDSSNNVPEPGTLLLLGSGLLGLVGIRKK